VRRSFWVAGQQQHRAGVRSLDAEQKIQEDEGERVPPMHEPVDVENQPGNDSSALDHEKCPRSDARRNLVGEHLAESRLVMVHDVDGMLVIVRAQLSPRELLFERGVS
jgi:hypothetical protein